MTDVSYEDRIAAYEAVERIRRNRYGETDWDKSFSAVKRSTRITDYQKIADLTKDVLSQIKTLELRERHREYLKTSKWKDRRKKKLEQENWTCESCGGNANQCHHTTYRHFASYDEEAEISTLQALCTDCHKKKEGEYDFKDEKQALATSQSEQDEVYCSMQENYLKDLKEMKKEEAKKGMQKNRRRWFNQEIDRVKDTIKEGVS